YVIVPADELLIVHAVTLSQQHVAHLPCGFQNVTANSVAVHFKSSHGQIQAQRQFWTCEELFAHEIAFSSGVQQIVAAAAARFWTARTTNATVMFRRPPKSA